VVDAAGTAGSGDGVQSVDGGANADATNYDDAAMHAAADSGGGDGDGQVLHHAGASECRVGAAPASCFAQLLPALAARRT